MSQFYVYVHKTKDAGIPFYVGKGTRRRAWSWSGRNEKWAETANRHGVKVELFSHYENENDAFIVEKALIAQLSEFFDLCNIAKGGAGGTSAGYHHSDKIKKIISNAQIGRPKSESHKVKLRDANIGKKLSNVTRAKMSESQRNRQDGNGLRGKAKSDGHKKALSNSVMGKQKSTNKSGYAGVYWHKASNKWCAQITVDGASRYLGTYETPEAASAVYEKELGAVRSRNGN